MTSSRLRGATPARPTRVPLATLHVTAESCPQVLLRVLGLIAQQGLIPYAIDFTRSQHSMRFAVAIDSLPPQRLETLLWKVEGIPAVTTACIGH